MEPLTDLFQAIGPNVVYLLMMAGIWLAITAVYLPGTGVPEVLAVVILVLGIAGLATLPAHLIGASLLIAALGCFLILLLYPRFWYLIPAGAVLQLLGSIFLFRVGSRPSVWAILLLNAVSLAYYCIVLRPGLSIQQKPKWLDDETLLGKDGEVVSTLDPVGTVRVHGELWRARSGEVIEPGRPVRVVARSGLELQVVPTDRTPVRPDPPHSPPDDAPGADAAS
jgi:membrane-bound serine protease (ClpP class)